MKRAGAVSDPGPLVMCLTLVKDNLAAHKGARVRKLIEAQERRGSQP